MRVAVITTMKSQELELHYAEKVLMNRHGALTMAWRGRSPQDYVPSSNNYQLIKGQQPGRDCNRTS